MRDYEAAELAAERNPRLTDVCINTSDGSVRLRSAHGLWLKKEGIDIGAPEVESLLEYPPGYDFIYSFTQAVDGNVHFKSRVITLEFVCLRPKDQWQTIRDELERVLQGQWRSFFLTDCPDLLWNGLFEVELTPGRYSADVKFKIVCDPFPVTAQGVAILDLAVLNADMLG